MLTACPDGQRPPAACTPEVSRKRGWSLASLALIIPIV